MAALLLAYLKTGLLVSLAVVGLLLALPLLDRRYTARWRCRVWVALAVLLLLPLPSLPGRAALRLTLPETAAEPLAGPLFSALPGGGQNAAGEQASGAADAPTVLDTAAGQEAAQQGPAQQEGGDHPPSGGLASSQQTVMQPPAAAQPQRDAGGSDGGVLPGPQRPQKQPLSPLSPLALCAAAWAAGAALLGFWRLAAYLWARRRALRWARPVTDACTLRLFRLACAGLGRRAPRLLQAPGLAGPLTAGLLRPVLLLPEKAVGGEDLPLILAHELTHLRRHDLAKKALLLAANTLHWPNPAAWLLLRRAQRDIELACDEAVTAGRGADYRDRYCGALLNSLAGARERALLPGARFARGKKEVRARLAHLFDRQPKRRGRAAAALLLAAVVTCSALVACTAPESEEQLYYAPAPTAHGETQALVQWPLREAVFGICDLSSGDTGLYTGLIESEFLCKAPEGVTLASLPADALAGSYVRERGLLDLVYWSGDPSSRLLRFYRSGDLGAAWESWELPCPSLGEREQISSLLSYERLNENSAFLSLLVTDEKGNIRAPVFHSADGGKTWSPNGSAGPPHASQVRALRFVNEEVGFSVVEDVGQAQTLYLTLDGGATWEAPDLQPLLQLLPDPATEACSIWVEGARATIGYRTRSILNDGIQICTDDYGQSWSWRARPEPLTGEWFSDQEIPAWMPLTKEFLDQYAPKSEPQEPQWAQRMWAYGARNGPETLLYACLSKPEIEQKAPPGLDEVIASGRGGLFPVTGSYIPEAGRWDLACLDPQAPDNSILFYRSLDNAESWSSFSVKISDLPQGRSLSRVVYYEPLSEEIAFLSLTESVPGVENSAVLCLYQTFNGGKTWSPRGELPLGADTVRHVRFLNDQVGFVTSLPGDSDSPRQLMRTLDGGRSWEELSIDFSSLPEQRLFSCCLWVESDKVVVGFSSSRGFPDGYQLLSTDFGESWSWREKPASPRPDGSPFTDLDDPAFLPI